MKKLIFFVLFACGSFAATAQGKLTDAAIEGRWLALSVEVPGKFYYNKTLDSIAIHDDIRKLIAKEALDNVIASARTSLQALSGFFVEFRKDRKTSMRFMDQITNGSYTLTDSTIQIREESGAGDKLKAKLIGSNLQIIIDQQDMEVVILLKKEES